MQRVAIIFDNQVRPDTTGVYCRRAIGQLTEVEHFLPSELSRIPRGKFDLFLNIDDGLRYRLPMDLRPAAWWAIDTHLDLPWYLEKGPDFDTIYTAQRDGAEALKSAGLPARWLPLAADPEFHRPHAVAVQHEVAFVGHEFPGPRAELLALIRRYIRRSFVGQAFFEEMAQIYSASKIVFNRSLRNDVNMRVFETLGCGSFLVTNDLSNNGQSELFRDGRELATYRTAEELLDKIEFYLRRDELRQQIAKAGHAEVLDKHTYLHRMRDILAESRSPRARGQVVSICGSPSRGASAAARPPVHSSPSVSAASSTAPAKRLLPPFALTSIVLVTFNQWPYTQACLASIRRFTKEPFELVVVDNGSTDGTADHLRADPSIRFIANCDNRGFPAAANQGLSAARGDFFVLLNNDTLVTTGWLQRLQAAARDPAVGLVGPVSNNVSGSQQIAVPYRELDQLELFAAEWARCNAGQRVECDRLIGFCLGFRRDVVDCIGLLDERFGIGNFEDDDFCFRARQAGFQTLIVVDSFVHHFGGRSFIASGLDFAGLMRENQAKFEAKWHSRPDGPATAANFSEPSPQTSTDSVRTSPPQPSAPTVPRFKLSKHPHGGLRLSRCGSKLSLCMIVRNNEGTIGAALASILPWVDEVIVVDTGSTDRTVEICRQYGARVEFFTWCDDFSAARNESLKYATGDWIFWMDSDDTIPEHCGRALRSLVDGPHPENVLGYVMQVCCPAPSDDGGTNVTEVDHLKLFRRMPGLVFERRIHEQLLPAIRRLGGEYLLTDIYVVHSGYDHSPEMRVKKLERDLRILELEHAAEPNHPFVLFNLGMTHADARNWDQAIFYLRRCVAVSAPSESQVPKAYSLLINALLQAHQPNEAEHQSRQSLRLFPDDKELIFRSAMLHAHFGRLSEAAAAYLRVLAEQGDRRLTSIDLALAGYKSRHNLAIVYHDQGRHDLALDEWRRIVAEVPSYRPGWRGLGDCLAKLGRTDELRQVSDSLLRNPGLRPVGILLTAVCNEFRGDKAGQRDALSRGRAEFPAHIELLREWCRFTFEQQDLPRAETALRELAAADPEDASAFHNLGAVLMQLDRPAEAREALNQSLLIRPDSPATQELLTQLDRNSHGQ